MPKTRFNHRLVPMYVPDDIWITDTTFRDGQQAMAPFTPAQIRDLYALMHRLGGENGLIRQSEFFVYTEKDRGGAGALPGARICVSGDHYLDSREQKDFELVKNLGIKETGILVSCSDYHIFNKMGLTRKQAMDKYLGVVKDALALGIRPRCHFEDITRADFYGFVVPLQTS